jgi:hypothetical protein
MRGGSVGGRASAPAARSGSCESACRAPSARIATWVCGARVAVDRRRLRGPSPDSGCILQNPPLLRVGTHEMMTGDSQMAGPSGRPYPIPPPAPRKCQRPARGRPGSRRGPLVAARRDQCDRPDRRHSQRISLPGRHHCRTGLPAPGRPLAPLLRSIRRSPDGRLPRLIIF